MEVLSFYLSAFLLVLFCTAFIKLLAALSIFRYGVGLTAAPFGLVIIALAMILSLFVIEPQIKSAGGISAFFSAGQINSEQLEKSFAPFIEKHTNPEVLSKFKAMARKNPAADENSFILKLSAFMLSELSAAFLLGLIIIVPFLIIDLLTANVMASLNITQLSTAVVSLPIKLLLFVALDGWLLISEKMLGGYF